MPSRFTPDWKALAEAQHLDLPDSAIQRLEAISKSLLGLRGLIDWGEEPAPVFQLDAPRPEPRP